jgi:uncharacterized membrane protein
VVVVAVVVVGLAALPVWLLLTAFVSRFVPGRWRALRLLWFSVVYAVLDAATTLAAAGMWLAAGAGRRLQAPAWQARHRRLLGWFLRRVVASARFTFAPGLRMEGGARRSVSGLDPEHPVLLVARDVELGETIGLLDAACNGPLQRVVHPVVGERVRLLPALDLLLARLGAVTVSSAGVPAAATVEAVQRLVAAADGDDVVLLALPAGADDLVEAALEAGPTATAVLVGRAGVEGFDTVRGVWQQAATGQETLLRLWQHPATAIPAAGLRRAWLADRWSEVDAWERQAGDDLAVARAAATAAAADERRADVMGLGARLRTPPLLGALIGALVLWWASLRPSLLPRSWMIQGLVSAICAAIGFGLGSLVHRFVRRVLRLRRTAVAPLWRDVALLVVLLAGVGALVVGPWRWLRWQREQRELVEMPDLAATAIVPMLLTTVAVFVLLLVVGRVVVHLLVRLDRAAARRLPLDWARWVLTAVVGVAVLVGAGFAARAFANWADQNFGSFDTTTREGVEMPTTPNASSGPGSLVLWDDLGFEGRNFVAGTPSADSIAAFTAGEPVEPIRVYVGLKSAPTVDERVALAVDELRRTNAFDREVLVVVTPTGTGWVDPDAARTIEHMYGGDTAIVAVQYGYLPSWISFLLDTTSPPELGRALFHAVHDAWAELPADDRPKLVAFGESLGSFGGEAAFARDTLAESVEAITSQVDAALFTGPTRDNPIFGAAVVGRDPGSPSWMPTVAAEPHLRITNRIADIVAAGADATWVRPRVLYVHHPSDAIGTWEPANLWSDPGWSHDPPPYDLPRAATWVPIVSFAQEAFDLMAGFSASPGYGHDYRTDFVHAWAAILPPDGWGEADSQRLLAHLGL